MFQEVLAGLKGLEQLIFLQIGKMMSVLKAASARRAEKALKEILDKV